MIMESFLILAFLMAVIINLFGMARTQTERQSEFLTNPITQDAETDSALPITGLTFATRIREYRLVEDNPADANLRTVRHASDGSLSIRGITMADQQTYNDGNQTLDEVNPITLVYHGRARLDFEEAIAKNTLYVAGTNGFGRAFVALVDNPYMILGKTKCTGTAVGDTLDVTFDQFWNGAGV